MFLTFWAGPCSNDSNNSVIFYEQCPKTRYDLMVLFFNYWNPTAASAIHRPQKEDLLTTKKRFLCCLLSNQYTLRNKFTSLKIAFDVDYALVLLQTKMYCFAVGKSTHEHEEFLIKRYPGEQNTLQEQWIYVIVFPMMRMRFSHFRLSANLNWSILVCSCQNRKITTSSSNKKRKYSVQGKLHY